MAGPLAKRQHLQSDRRQNQKKILLPRNVPIPLRQTPHGSRKKLLHRRLPSKIQTHAKLQRPLPHGLRLTRPTRGKRSNKKQQPPKNLDRKMHTDDERPAKPDGLLL